MMNLNPLQPIFNLPMSLGIFFDKLKIAKITQIRNTTDARSVQSYRSISALSEISIIFESYVPVNF